MPPIIVIIESILIVLLIWLLSVAWSVRNDALGERDEWHARYDELCQKLDLGQESHREAINDARSYLAPRPTEQTTE